MSNRSTNGVSRFSVLSPAWPSRFLGVVAICAIGILMTTLPAGAHPQTRQGFFAGFGVATGTADVYNNSESGSGGSFRLGYVINPKFALGLESNTWLQTDNSGAWQLGTLTGAVTVFPAEGLVLRAGFGAGEVAGAGDGVSGEVGTGWTLGAAYEFRVMRSFAIGPQIDYSHVNLSYEEYTYTNIGLSMNWYFIPK